MVETEDSKRFPKRTCVGCRQVDNQARLRRVVLSKEGQVCLDFGRRRAQGRGAYVHGQEKCLIAAVSRGGFERSFRRKVQSLCPRTAQAFRSNEDQE